MRKKKTRGLFDEQFRLEKISKIKDPLEKLNRFIDFESFRPIIDSTFPVNDPVLGGRPPYDRILMFKILILQRMYNLSDDSMEYQILDRLSFSRFLGLELCDDVPDSKTIWVYREQLKTHDTIHKIFSMFQEKLEKAGLLVNNGAIVDASITEKPRQRNTREENKQLKQGSIPEDWQNNPNKMRQKDVDADWLKKNGKSYYGYKNHIKTDLGSKLITNYVITPASTHDSAVLDDLLEGTDAGQYLYADSAYSGDPCKKVIRKTGMKNKVHKKAYRNKPLSKYQQKQNTVKSRTRARIEHVFGYQWTNLDGSCLIRAVGLDRCAQAIALRNITYNFFRSIHLIETKNLAITL
jgi:IS5 family transposase